MGRHAADNAYPPRHARNAVQPPMSKSRGALMQTQTSSRWRVLIDMFGVVTRARATMEIVKF